MSEPTTEPDPAAEEETPVPANRAERRAKGKKSGTPAQVFAKGQAPAGRGAVQSPRQYGNRRSG
jgi:hypothetical protein